MSESKNLDKIDSLIYKFKSVSYTAQYEQNVYEANLLIRALYPETDEAYKTFISIVKSSKGVLLKAEAIVGVLKGIRTQIDICQNKKYQVFISSTYVDLIPYRNAVAEAIIFANHIPAGMENFKASSNNPTEYIKKVIDQSDYYVLLLGQRYGSIQDTKRKLSFTMMEYEYAIEKGMVVLPFFYNGDHSLPSSDLDTQGALFDQFKSIVAERHVVSYFSAAEELKTKLTQSLNEAIVNTPQRGWIRL